MSSFSSAFVLLCLVLMADSCSALKCYECHGVAFNKEPDCAYVEKSCMEKAGENDEYSRTYTSCQTRITIRSNGWIEMYRGCAAKGTPHIPFGSDQIHRCEGNLCNGKLKGGIRY